MSSCGVAKTSTAGEKRRLSDDSETSSSSSSSGRPAKLRRPTGLPKLSTTSGSSSRSLLPPKSPRYPPGCSGGDAAIAPTPKLPSSTSIGCAGDQNVRVVVRIRPLSAKEKREQSKETLTATPGSDTIYVDKNRKPEFDAVFGPGTAQGDVYERTAGDTVRVNIFKGFNVTILAYGQTGSGKTYSMGTNGGENSSNGGSGGDEVGKDAANASPSSNLKGEEVEKPLVPPSEGDGIIPRAVYDLFLGRSSMKSGSSRVKVEMSYLEIYNEEARDLLSEDDKLLQIRDSKTEGVVVQGLSRQHVRSPQDVSDLMDGASERRVVASTAMNAVSSRSHAICTLHVTIAPLNASEVTDGEAGEETSHEEIRSKLTLVDLAGSERIKRTGAEGARMKEGININKGLFVLGQVVSALSELGQGPGGGGASNAFHIPYRDSKLTRLLQDSLGGNSKTVMLACVSPADSNTEESINTLRYATRARNIKNSAVRNVVAAGLSAAEAAALRRENGVLKLELARAQARIAAADKDAATSRLAMANSGAVFAARPAAKRVVFSDASSTEGETENDSVNVEKLPIVSQLRARCTSLTSKVEQMKEQVRSSTEDALTASLKADRWELKCERIAASAKEKGVVFLEDEAEDEEQDLVSKLRGEVAELREELREARADAAIARATAAAVVAGGGDLSAAEEMALLSKGDENEPTSAAGSSGAVEGSGDGDEDENEERSEELTKELVTMSGTIEEKEAMVAQMNRERDCMETLHSHFEGAMKRLQDEVQVLTSERETLLAQMEEQSASTTSTGGRSRRNKAKKNGADDPAKQKLRERVGDLEQRIRELRRKESEHAKSLRMKEQAERRCAKLAADIANDKKRRAELQRKLKESSKERRDEKMEAQKNAAKMMRDRQKLQRELSKVKDAAARQARVLKQKAVEALRKQKREAEMQRKRSNAASMRAAASGADAVTEERKDELSAWVKREVDAALALDAIRGKIDEQTALVEEATSRKAQIVESSGGDDDAELEELESEIVSRQVLIKQLEANVEEVRAGALGGKTPHNALSTANSAFVDGATWQGLSRPEVRFVTSAVFDVVIDSKCEAEAIRTKEEYNIAAAVRKAVSEEKRKAKSSLAELELQHSETVMTLLESTKGAVEHKVRSDLLSTEHGTELDLTTKSAIDDMLGSFLSGCDEVGNTVKDELQKVHSQQEDMLCLQARVAEGLALAPVDNESNAEKKKAKAKKCKRKSLSDDEKDFIFEEEEDDGEKYDSDDSDWSPDVPKPRKSMKPRRGGEEKEGGKEAGGKGMVKGNAIKHASSVAVKSESDSLDEALLGENIPLGQSEEAEKTEPPKNLGKLKVAELRELLRGRGLAVSGKKADLLRRLRSDPSTAAAAKPQPDAADNTKADKGNEDTNPAVESIPMAEDEKENLLPQKEAVVADGMLATRRSRRVSGWTAPKAKEEKENSPPHKEAAVTEGKPSTGPSRGRASSRSRSRSRSRPRSKRTPLAAKPSQTDTGDDSRSKLAKLSPPSTKSSKSVAFFGSPASSSETGGSGSKRQTTRQPITQSAKKRRRNLMSKAVNTALASVENVLGNIN